MTIGLDPKQLARLRDYLLAAGERTSLTAVGAETHESSSRHPLEGEGDAKTYFDAVAEAVYLVSAADGNIAPAEHDALRGALREITAGMMRTSAIDALLATFEASRREQGGEARLAAVCATLKGSIEAAEAAFVFSAAVALADGTTPSAENDALSKLADKLGIDQARAERLLGEMGPSAST